MKKFLSLVILSAVLMTMAGCKKTESSSSEPAPSTRPSSSVSSVQPVTEEEETESAVTLQFKELNGYWANSDGEYIVFKADENGDNIFEYHDYKGNIQYQGTATEVAATSKTGIVITFRDGKTLAFDTADTYNMLLRWTKDNDETEVFAFASLNAEEMQSKLEETVNRAKSYQ